MNMLYTLEFSEQRFRISKLNESAIEYLQNASLRTIPKNAVLVAGSMSALQDLCRLIEKERSKIRNLEERIKALEAICISKPKIPSF